MAMRIRVTHQQADGEHDQRWKIDAEVVQEKRKKDVEVHGPSLAETPTACAGVLRTPSAPRPSEDRSVLFLLRRQLCLVLLYIFGSVGIELIAAAAAADVI